MNPVPLWPPNVHPVEYLDHDARLLREADPGYLCVEDDVLTLEEHIAENCLNETQR